MAAEGEDAGAAPTTEIARPQPSAANTRDTGTPAQQPAKQSQSGTADTAARLPPARRPSGPPPEFRGPDVTLIAGEERTVYEYRQNGQLRMIKVVPKVGKPYYLTPRDPTRGFGDLEQADMLLAEWVLWEF